MESAHDDPVAHHLARYVLAELRNRTQPVPEGAHELFTRALQTVAMISPNDVLDAAGILAERLFQHSLRAGDEMVDRERAGGTLTPREVELLEILLVSERTAPTESLAETARRLFISTNTFKHHLGNMGQKLFASGRAEILRRARERGYIVPRGMAEG
jgi:DNA-binding CsgD family transcriptional regulator